MKRKGFTLVELLAVIVILAIIALIATPMILGVIEDARKGSAKSSALGYVDAVEKSSLVYAVNNGSSFKDGEYEVEGKNLKQNDNVIYTVDYKGDTATGTITISNGEVTIAELNFNSIINKTVEVRDNKAEIKEDVVKEPEDDNNNEPDDEIDEPVVDENVDANQQPNTNVYYAFGTPTTSSPTDFNEVIASSGSNVFVRLYSSQLSACIYRNSKLECFKNNNYEEESTHIKNVFGESSCSSLSSNVVCSDADFGCNVSSDGDVYCSDYSSDHSCNVFSAGNVFCN